MFVIPSISERGRSGSESANGRPATLTFADERAAMPEQSQTDLEAATRVVGDGRDFHATLSRDWEVGTPSGGYLAAIALRAVSQVADIQQPASLYCHFLSIAHFAEVELTVNVLKRGRRCESFCVSMLQDGKPVLEAMIRTAADEQGYEHQACEAPRLPSPEWLLSPDTRGPRFAFWNNLERRSIEQRTDAPRVQEWTRFRPQSRFEDPFLDAARSLILLDAYSWLAASRPYPERGYAAVNLDASVWFHRYSPGCDWLLIDQECPIAGRGLMGVSGRVWDRDGRLLATGSAQLCCVPQR
jgi:acyl-CoA thioesterase II